MKIPRYNQSLHFSELDSYRIEYVYLSIKDAHDRQYNYMKITIFTLIGMIRLIGFNIQDIHICTLFSFFVFHRALVSTRVLFSFHIQVP